MTAQQEQQLWKLVARQCRPGGAIYRDRIGLCSTLGYFRDRSRATERLWQNKPKGTTMFWWPRTNAGYRDRVKFCLRMAKLAAPRKKKIVQKTVTRKRTSKR